MNATLGIERELWLPCSAVTAYLRSLGRGYQKPQTLAATLGIDRFTR